ncbi:MAG: trigger factor [Erysipelotrichaceae bacterium]|nr:trigger factor [Erysipelotrichaceae bacterium]
MKTQIEKTDKQVTITVVFDGDEYKSAVNTVLIEQGQEMTIEGYEKGQAPIEVVKQELGANLYYGAGNRLLDSYFNEIIDSVDESLADVSVNVSKFTEDFIEMVIVCDKEPVVDLKKYKGLKVKAVEVTEASEEDIAAKLRDYQNQFAYFITKDMDATVEMGDTATIDYAGYKDGVAFEGGTAKGYDLAIGSHSFIPGFEEGVVGMKVEETKDIPLKFPEQYHSAELAGAEVVFTVTVQGIKSKQLPEIDDELAQRAGAPTLDVLKENIKQDILTQRQAAANETLREALLNQLMEENDVDIPEVMIQNQVRNMVQQYRMQLQQQGITLEQILQFNGTTYDDFVASARTPAIKNLKSGLILRAIVKAENITVADNEVDEQFIQMASGYSMTLDQFKQAVGPNYEQMADGVRQEIAYNKAVDLIKENAIIE